MRLKVSSKGLLIPGILLKGIEEVEILNTGNTIVLVPISRVDLNFLLGMHPVDDDLIDGSEKHDLYVDQ